MIKQLFFIFALIVFLNAKPSIHNKKVRDEIASKLKRIANELKDVKDVALNEEKKEKDEQKKRETKHQLNDQQRNSELKQLKDALKNKIMKKEKIAHDMDASKMESRLQKLAQDLKDMKASIQDNGLKKDEAKKVYADLKALHTHLGNLKRSIEKKKKDEEAKKEKDDLQKEIDAEMKLEDEEIKHEQEEERKAEEEMKREEEREEENRKKDVEKDSYIKKASDSLKESKDYFNAADELLDAISNKKKKREMSLEDQLSTSDDEPELEDNFARKYQRSYYTSEVSGYKTEVENLYKSLKDEKISADSAQDKMFEAQDILRSMKEIKDSLTKIKKERDELIEKKRKDNEARAKVIMAADDKIDEKEFEEFDTIEKTDTEKDVEMNKIDSIMGELESLKTALKDGGR